MSGVAFITGKKRTLQSIAKPPKKRAAPRKRGVARGRLSSYNAAQRGQYPQESRLDDLAQRLIPLRFGKSVVLAMELPPVKVKKPAPQKPKLVVIAPGQMHGFRRNLFLISVVGMGSALVKLNDPTAVAKLVLARMPARLARELMNRIHQVFEESHHGNRPPRS